MCFLLLLNTHKVRNEAKPTLYLCPCGLCVFDLVDCADQIQAVTTKPCKQH